MAHKDEIKWNKKYQDIPSLLETREASNKLISILDHVIGTSALDVACGAGRNAIYLASKGFNVLALDISKIALEELNNKGIKNITAKYVDLDEYDIPKNSYDLIVMTNFLDRNLIPNLAMALKKDGILFIETYMDHEVNEKPPSNTGFLLKKGELKDFFDDKFEVVDYEEYLNGNEEMYKMMKQSISVRKL